MATLGAIEIQMLADLARLKKDMDEAKGVVGTAANVMKGALAAVAGALSVGAFAGWIKGAIDAADEASKLAQKAGIATSEVAGLQLAFRLSGAEAGSMSGTMARLSKEIGVGNDTLKALGVTTRTTDGGLRSTKDVLYDVADAFAGMKDGTDKTALAVKLFGKAGADMIPLLNGGAAGLREMDETARQLGLTIDTDTGKKAEQFNDTLDLIKLSGTGVATQVAAQLLPTITALAGGFFKTLTEGDRLRAVADILGAGLKGLFSVGAIGVEVFNTLGKVVGAVGGAIVAVAQGEFRQARDIIGAGAEDIRSGWGKTADSLKAIWSSTGDAQVEAAARQIAAGKSVVVQAEQREAAEKAAAEQAKARAAEAKKRLDEQLKAEAEQLKWQKQWHDEQSKMALQRLAQEERAQAAVDASVAKAGEMVAAIKRETAMLGMSNVEREIAVALLKLEEQGIAKGTYAYEVYAEQIRKAIVDRETVRGSIEQSRAIGDEWKKLTDDIGRGLTDSLYRAFESGKGFFRTLWDGIVNTFKTTVLKMAINAVVNPVNAAIGGVLGGLGLPGVASAATGGAGGGLGTLASLAGLGGSLSSFGGAALSGLMSWGSGVGGVGGMLGAGSTLLGAGNFAAGLGAFAGALGPVALGLAALSALQGKPTPHTGSVVGLDAAGLRTLMGDDSQITNSLSQETDTALRTLVAGSAGILNDLSSAFGLGSSFSGTAKFAADGKDASIGQFILGRDGQILNQVGSGASSLTGGGQYAFYGSDRMAAYGQFAGDVAGVTRQALAALDLPEWAKAEIMKLGAAATLDDITRLAAELVQRKGEMNAPAASASETPALEPSVSASQFGDEFRLLRERVDLVTEAVNKLLASTEAGLTSVADNTGRTARTLDSWDGGGAVLTEAST